MKELKKSILENLVEAKDQADKEVVEYFREQIKNTSADLQKAGIELSNAQVPDSDPVIDRVFQETGIAEDVVKALDKYFKKTKDYSLLRTELRNLLGDPKQSKTTKNMTPTPKDHDEEFKPPIDKKPPAVDKEKTTKTSTKAKSEWESSSSAPEKKVKDPKDKGTKVQNTQGGSKDMFAAFDSTKKPEGSTNKDLFASFNTNANPASKPNVDDFNSGKWENAQEEEEKKGTEPDQKQTPNEFGWGEAAGDQQQDDGQGQKNQKGFNFDDFGDAFNEEEAPKKDKKTAKSTKEIFGSVEIKPKSTKEIFGDVEIKPRSSKEIFGDAEPKPKEKVEGGRVQLQSKDGKEKGMIIVNDESSFAGFNFGGSKPPERNNQSQVQNDTEERQDFEPAATKVQKGRRESDHPPQNQDFGAELGGNEQQGGEEQAGFGFGDEFRETKKHDEEEEKRDAAGGFGFGEQEQKNEGEGEFGFGF